MGEASERQPTWVIDSTAANNRDTGIDAAHPIRDVEELQRRLGKGTAALRQATTITIAANATSSDPLNIPFAVRAGGSLTIQGTATVVGSGTFGAPTAINRATQQMQQVLDGAQNFAPHVGRLIRIPSGARSGAYAVLATNIGGTGARTGRWQIPNRAAGQSSTTTAPLVGDPYEIITVPKLYLGGFSVEQAAGDATPYCNLHNLELDAGASYSGALRGLAGIPIYMTACVTQKLNIDADFIVCIASRFGGADPAVGIDWRTSLIAQVWGCVSFIPHFVCTGATVQFDRDTLFQGCQHGTNGNAGSYVAFGTCAFFDCTPSLFLDTAGNRTTVGVFNDGVGALWGTNNTGQVSVGNGTVMSCSTIPTVNSGLGLGREIRLGAVPMLWSDMPAVDASTGARVSL
jgi:hypothetical protein